MESIIELRKLEVGDLKKKLESFRGEFMKAKQEIMSGKEKDVKKALKIKRNIARILTVLNAKRP